MEFYRKLPEAKNVIRKVKRSEGKMPESILKSMRF